MQIHAELCHVDTLRCVVRVEARDGDQRLGSALGEAQTSEAAEDRAIERLRRRLSPSQPAPMTAQEPMPSAQSGIVTTDSQQLLRTEHEPRQPEQPAQTISNDSAAQFVPDPPNESPTDPEDWSDELAAIDLEVRRIEWDRAMERRYLERVFGFGSRHRLTRYSDLTAYLRQLRALQPGDQPDTAEIPIRRSDLIQQGDVMLQQLGWSAEQARRFLQQQLAAKSRQQLSDEQLLQFNILLEDQVTTKGLS